MAPAELSPTRRQRTKTRVNWNPSYLTVSDSNQEPSQADELRRPGRALQADNAALCSVSAPADAGQHCKTTRTYAQRNPSSAA